MVCESVDTLSVPWGQPWARALCHPLNPCGTVNVVSVIHDTLGTLRLIVGYLERVGLARRSSCRRGDWETGIYNDEVDDDISNQFLIR